MKRARYVKAIAMIVHLAALYPLAFFVLERRRKPLEIGIRDKLLAADAMKPDDLSLALMVYTRSHGYHRAMRVGATRLGLDGGAAGTVSAEQAAWAEEMERRRAAKGRSRKEAAARAAEETARQVAEEAARAVEAAKPKRVSLNDLKQAAAARRQKETIHESA